MAVGHLIGYKMFIAHVRRDYVLQCGALGQHNNSLGSVMRYYVVLMRTLNDVISSKCAINITSIQLTGLTYKQIMGRFHNEVLLVRLTCIKEDLLDVAPITKTNPLG